MNNNTEYPIISIVTPSYNQGQFIADTIESVINQEGDFYIDYIIMDGASTDNSVEIIKKYAALVEKCPVVYSKEGVSFRGYGNCKGVSYRWWSEKDGGQSAAINKGYKKSIGYIFNWLNSDDRLLPGCLREVVMWLYHTKYDIVYGGCIAYDDKNQFLWEHNPKEVTVINMLYRHEGVPQPSVFWKKELTDRRKNLVDENLRYTMDTELWFYFFQHRLKWHKIEKNLSVQIYHPASKSCEGSVMFEKFKPENDLIKGIFRKGLGIDHFYFTFLVKIEKTLPFIYSLLSKWRYY